MEHRDRNQPRDRAEHKDMDQPLPNECHDNAFGMGEANFVRGFRGFGKAPS